MKKSSLVGREETVEGERRWGAGEGWVQKSSCLFVYLEQRESDLLYKPILTESIILGLFSSRLEFSRT